MMEGGFLYLVISAASQSLSGVWMGICVDRLLTGREERGSRRKRIAFWSVIGTLLACSKCLMLTGPYTLVLNPVFVTAHYIFMLTYFYRDKAPVKIFHASMILLQNVSADVILMVALGEIKNLNLFRNSFENPYMAERSVLIAMLSMVLNLLYLLLILRRKKGTRSVSPVGIASSLTLIFLLGGIWMCWRSQGNTGDANLYMTLLCVGDMLEFGLAVFYVSQMEKREIQEEEARLSRAMALEKIHYEQAEARREEMAKLRHDSNNILTSVLFLVKNERIEEAKTILRDLMKRLEGTKK